MTTAPIVSPITQLKSFLESDDLKKRFQMVLGKRSNQFISSLISSVQGNKSLQECEPRSIISAALIAAALDLPIDANLGFAAIVPYNSKDTKVAQFQIMAKGFIQLAIRTGQYAKMNYSEIYADELKSYNPITKEVVFEPSPVDSQREKGQEDKIVGYYAWFRLASGFEQSLYMTKEQIKNHAKKYSASYKTDIAKNWKSSKWSSDFDAMAKKTIIKLLLSKWGILSVEMRRALTEDQKVFSDQEGSYADNPGQEITTEKLPDAFPVHGIELKPDPDAQLRKELQELNPNHEPWQIDALLAERKGAA